MLYSVPGRSSIEIAPETAARLAATIVAIKEPAVRWIASIISCKPCLLAVP